jgi:hypothetical protein
MLQKKTKHIITSWAIFAFFMIFFSIGCVRAVPLYIAHEPLNPAANKRDGKILIKKFVNKIEIIEPNTYYIGSEEDKIQAKRQFEKSRESGRASLGMLMTNFFAEALEEAGYKVIFQEEQSADSQNQAKFDAIIAGEIWGFNIEGGKKSLTLYSKLWVKVEALDPVNQKVLWRKQFIGEEKNANWSSNVSEYNKVIRQAATKALNQAVTEFSSDGFYKAIKKETNKKNDSKQQRQYKR